MKEGGGGKEGRKEDPPPSIWDGWLSWPEEEEGRGDLTLSIGGGGGGGRARRWNICGMNRTVGGNHLYRTALQGQGEREKGGNV